MLFYRKLSKGKAVFPDRGLPELFLVNLTVIEVHHNLRKIKAFRYVSTGTCYYNLVTQENLSQEKEVDVRRKTFLKKTEEKPVTGTVFFLAVNAFFLLV